MTRITSLLIAFFLIFMMLSLSPTMADEDDGAEDVPAEVTLSPVDIDGTPIAENNPSPPIMSSGGDLNTVLLVVYPAILGVALLTLTVGFVYVASNFSDKLGNSVPKESFRDFTLSGVNMAQIEADKLRQKARETVTPVDDFISIGVDWSLEQVIGWLKNNDFADEDIAKIIGAAQQPQNSMVETS